MRTANYISVVRVRPSGVVQFAPCRSAPGRS